MKTFSILSLVASLVLLCGGCTSTGARDSSGNASMGGSIGQPAGGPMVGHAANMAN
ncbi:MAG TPA: hypothetical protein VGP24_01175 [Glaciihabitans sp.]|jgi:hypothetical protein|nr:hypothetical protein [Glaciihabitans sp.]